MFTFIILKQRRLSATMRICKARPGSIVKFKNRDGKFVKGEVKCVMRTAGDRDKVMVLAEGFLKFIPVDECSLFAAKVPDGYYSPNGVKLGDDDVQI